MLRRTGGVLSSATDITTRSAILRLTPRVSRPASSRSSAQPDAAGAFGAVDGLQAHGDKRSRSIAPRRRTTSFTTRLSRLNSLLSLSSAAGLDRGALNSALTLATSSRRMVLILTRRYA